MPRKTEFELDNLGNGSFQKASIAIIGQAPSNKPYVHIELIGESGRRYEFCIQDRDLERFAVNILKALGSDKLKK